MLFASQENRFMRCCCATVCIYIYIHNSSLCPHTVSPLLRSDCIIDLPPPPSGHPTLSVQGENVFECSILYNAAALCTRDCIIIYTIDIPGQNKEARSQAMHATCIWPSGQRFKHRVYSHRFQFFFFSTPSQLSQNSQT